MVIPILRSAQVLMSVPFDFVHTAESIGTEVGV